MTNLYEDMKNVLILEEIMKRLRGSKDQIKRGRCNMMKRKTPEMTYSRLEQKT